MFRKSSQNISMLKHWPRTSRHLSEGLVSEDKDIEDSLTEREKDSMMFHLWSQQLSAAAVNVPGEERFSSERQL